MRSLHAFFAVSVVCYSVWSARDGWTWGRIPEATKIRGDVVARGWVYWISVKQRGGERRDPWAGRSPYPVYQGRLSLGHVNVSAGIHAPRSPRRAQRHVRVVSA